MKYLIYLILNVLIILCENAFSQVGILVNPYLDYSGLPSPTYVNSFFANLEVVHNTTSVPGFTGEYEIDLDNHQWNNYRTNHVVTYDFEVVGFPFTMNCAFQPNSCANCSNPDRILNLPDSPYDDVTHTWSQYLYNDMKAYGLGQFEPGGESVLANGNHQTLVSDFFNKSSFSSPTNRIYFPHTALKLNLYLHCNDNYVNPGQIIEQVSYYYDNTRMRMRFYPFKLDNCGSSSESNYDVIFRPTTVNVPYPGYMFYDDIYQDNSAWTEADGTLNYHSVNHIDLNGCTSESNPTGNPYFWYDGPLNTPYYGAPFFGPYALQTCHLFGFEGTTLAGYEHDPDPLSNLNQNEGIEQEYKIEDEFDLNIINSNEKIIYNPSKVILEPSTTSASFTLNFPTYYTFKTIRGTFPTVTQVNQDDISDNGGPFYPKTLVPVRTDLRSEDISYPHDINNIRHSVYSSKYILNSGSTIFIESCVSLFDLCFDVNQGASLIITDYSQIRGKEDQSTFPIGRFKIRGLGGAILRNYADIQYVQNGIITQSQSLHYIAISEIVSGDNVDLDSDQGTGNFEIQSGADVTFEAGEYIHLQNGFNVSGGTFHGIINDNLPIPAQCFWGSRFAHANIDNLETETVAAASSSLLVLPNPSEKEIILKNITFENGIAKIIIYDNQGKVVITQDLATGSKVDISQLIPGLYIVKVSGSNQFAKFIKS